MHRDFAEWYRAVALDPKGQELELRWRGVEYLAAKVDADDIVELARLTIRRPSIRPASLTKIQGAFLKYDPTFKLQKNAAELSILAGAALVHLMSREKTLQLGVAGALVLESAFCAGLRGEDSPRDFRTGANAFLMSVSHGMRASAGWPSASKPSLKVDLSTAPSNPSILPSELEKVAKAVVDLHKEHREWTATIHRRFQLQQEEIDVAWWVFGGRSSTLNTPVSKISPAAAPLVLGRELGGMITIEPGPQSSDALLERMLGYLEVRPPKVTLEEAVFATPSQWQREWVDEVGTDYTGDVLPVLAAVRQAADGAKKSEWKTWAKRWLGISHTDSFTLFDLARQTYRECLAVRALAGLRNSNGE